MSLSNEQRAHDIALSVVRCKQEQEAESLQNVADSIGKTVKFDLEDFTKDVYLNAYNNALNYLNSTDQAEPSE